MTNQQKKNIATQRERIMKLEKAHLILYVQELYLSKPNMDDEMFREILSLCDLRMAELKEMVSPEVVKSVIEEGEF